MQTYQRCILTCICSQTHSRMPRHGGTLPEQTHMRSRSRAIRRHRPTWAEALSCAPLHLSPQHSPSDPHTKPAETHSRKHMRTDAPGVSLTHRTPGGFELVRVLHCLIPTLERGGRGYNYPHFTGKETKVEIGELGLQLRTACCPGPGSQP